MGYYINHNSQGKALDSFLKAEQLMLDGAKVVEPVWQENLICVVENGIFDAAGYAFDEKEFEQFLYPDGRKKTWLTHPLAKKLSGYEE